MKFLALFTESVMKEVKIKAFLLSSLADKKLKWLIFGLKTRYFCVSIQTQAGWNGITFDFMKNRFNCLNYSGFDLSGHCCQVFSLQFHRFKIFFNALSHVVNNIRSRDGWISPK